MSFSDRAQVLTRCPVDPVAVRGRGGNPKTLSGIHPRRWCQSIVAAELEESPGAIQFFYG